MQLVDVDHVSSPSSEHDMQDGQGLQSTILSAFAGSIID